ncbi:MAG: DUF3990 domain-containing protein [Gemmataceae bacterium]|nr:DUF3990 domain-containing protein [Gemmataceae bacterium]
MAIAPKGFALPAWTNSHLTLFHGTIQQYAAQIVQKGVHVQAGRRYTDFGQGFYTTTVERQARAWAWQLSQRPINKKRGAGGHPAVIAFDVDRDLLSRLECVWFVRGAFDAVDYWRLVHHCRRGRAGHARTSGQIWYDVAIGPVAASWRMRLALHDSDQVSIHTFNGATLLDNGNPRVIP